MKLQIKICGITSAETAAAAAAAGADLIGFVFYPPSVRNLRPDRAAEIARALPTGVARVAVMLHPDQALVDEVCAALRPDWLQTDASDLPGLTIPPDCRILPVYRGPPPASGPLPERLLFESGHSGGGRRADWAAAAALARRSRLMLAGGLDAGNVGEAVRCVRPHGVDVSSGVESAPGVKDPERIEAFIAAARAAAARLEMTNEH